MLIRLYTSYLDTEKSTFTESEIKPLIVSSFLKVKFQSENYTTKQIEEKVIEVTAMLCMRNGKGIPIIIRTVRNKFR